MSRQDRRSEDRTAKKKKAPVAPPRRPYVLLLGVVLVAAAGWWGVNWYLHRAPVRDGAPSWSPDGRSIVFYSERGGAADLFVMDDKGEGVRQVTNTPADEGAPAFSPDGKLIAYDTDRDGNYEIYTIGADGLGPRRLTRHAGRDLAPAWAPDGSKIVFMSDRDARPEFDIYRMNPDGSAVERLTTKPTNWFPQYSPDGRRLAMHVWRDVHVMDLTTKALKRLTYDPLNGMYPTWSPDGNRLAFMSSRNGATELFTMMADGTDQQRVVTMPRGSVIDPRWSPTGDRLVFVHVPEENAQDDQAASQQRIIYVAELATGKLTRLSR
jgi:Tol biopolymer transport system component